MRRSLIVVVVLAACGDDGGGSSPADYPAALRDARCQHLVTCGLFPSLAECRLHFPAPTDPSLAAAVRSGATSFDSSAATQCLAAIAAESCDFTSMSAREQPAACDMAVTGAGATNATCASNSECVSDRCIVPPCTNACCMGSCGPPIAPAGAGQSCAGHPCEAGLACSANNICVMRMPAGSPCQSIDECDYGLACGGLGSTCIALPKLGESCGADNPCGDLGAGCIGGTCKMIGLPGDSCTVESDCSPYYRCDTASHLCALDPTLGQTCTGLCGDDSFCAANGQPMGTCTARKAVGETCQGPFECQSFYCDLVMHACSLPAVCI